MFNKEKIEKTEKIIEKKYHPGIFLSLTMEIAALSVVKPNFGGGGLRAGVKRASVIKANKVSKERKVLSKWNKKHFSMFHKCSLLDIQTN